MTLKPATAPARRSLTTMLCAAALITIDGCATSGGRPHVATLDPPPVPAPATGQPIPAGHEAVLADNTQLIAHTADGRLKIEAGPGTRRIYTWDELRRGAVLKPRRDAFAGADGKGLYFDGRPQTWASADGIVDLRAEEGRHDFDTVNDARIWMQIRRLYFVYNDSGMAVGWKREGDTLHVEVWQFYIDGQQPTSMPGADDTAIELGPVHVVQQKMKPELVFPDGHTEPYTTATAHKLNGSSAPGQGNWFERNIKQPVENALDLDSDSDDK